MPRDAAVPGTDDDRRSPLTRRELLAGAVTAAASLGALACAGGIAPGTAASAGGLPSERARVATADDRAAGTMPAPLRRADAGRIRQSVSRWPYASIPLPQFAAAVKAMGLSAIDLLQPEEWPIVRDAGLVCSMGYPTKRNDFIATGFNDGANHAMLLRELESTIPLAARAGVPNVIAMFGNRHGASDAEGVDTCIAGLKQIAPLAEEQGVTVCVELLNSKVDHRGYQGDHTAFGAAVTRGVGSARVKLLYDIYHMQIMEGDVIRTVREHLGEIAHFHTGGIPGRHEIDGGQELNYRAVATAVADGGFAGFLAHEFMPTRDPLTSLREAASICSV